LVNFVVGADILERTIQEVGVNKVGRCGIKDLLMGMARRDDGYPLLMVPFIARSPQTWSPSSTTSKRTNLLRIIGTTMGRD
jgi:hypothetical protein